MATVSTTACETIRKPTGVYLDAPFLRLVDHVEDENHRDSKFASCDVTSRVLRRFLRRRPALSKSGLSAINTSQVTRSSSDCGTMLPHRRVDHFERSTSGVKLSSDISTVVPGKFDTRT